MINFAPDNLINLTYLTAPDEDGQRFRAKIIQKIVEHENTLEQEPDRIKFLVSIEMEKADEIVAYNDIANFIEEEMSNTADQLWTFKDIIAHEGPLAPGDPSYKGSTYNVMIAWEDGSHTFEPLSIIPADCPVICARYAKLKGLLDTPGWKRFKKLRITSRKWYA